jgi:hypothetical protein
MRNCGEKRIVTAMKKTDKLRVLIVNVERESLWWLEVCFAQKAGMGDVLILLRVGLAGGDER